MVDKWMDVLIDKWMGGWMDGWMGEVVIHSLIN